jgi:hypothetical protein
MWLEKEEKIENAHVDSFKDFPKHISFEGYTNS